MRRPLALLAAGIVAAAAVLLPALPASAAYTDGYASFTWQGEPRAFSGQVEGPSGFPTTSFTTTSAGGAGTGPQTGASTWQPPGTPLADAFGSSQGLPYLNLRPTQNNPTSPSTTTYAFAGGSPTGGWGFALGDIEAERLTVSATAPDGSAVPIGQLGYTGGYNTCSVATGSAACGNTTGGRPVPGPALADIDPSATELTIADPAECSYGGSCDTAGASVAFLPTTAIATLTIRSTWIQGLPVYQTWFAMDSAPLTGTVTVPPELPAEEVVVELLDPAGAVLEEAPVDPSGGYVFPQVFPGEPLAVRIADTATACAPGDASTPVTVDPAGSVAAPLEARGLGSVRGTVTGSGEALAAVTVDLLRDEAVIATTTTDAQGAYRFDGVADGALSVRAAAYEGFGAENADIVLDCADLEAPTLALVVDPVDPVDPVTPTDPSQPAAPGADDTPDALAETGADAAPLLAGAAALLLLGTALLLRRRRA